jgi:hypothetical protein
MPKHHELSAAAEEGYRLLHELFGAPDQVAPSTRGRRRYVLELRDGVPGFRDADIDPAVRRSEFELSLHQIFDEVLDNDIVPQKLAKAFPGSRFEPTRY